MSNQTVQKKMLVIVGLLFLAQTVADPAQAISFLPNLDGASMYIEASTSDKVIVFNTTPKSSEKIIVKDNVDAKATVEVKDNFVPTIEQIKEYVLKEAKNVGISANEVAIIINCESRWDPKAKGHNTNGSYDLGLWQINSIHKNLSDKDKLDYKVSTKWALTKRLHDGNWSAWSCSRKLASK